MAVETDSFDGDFGIAVLCSVDLAVRPLCNELHVVETGNGFRDGFKGSHHTAERCYKNEQDHRDKVDRLPHVRCAADQKNVCPIYFFENSKE